MLGISESKLDGLDDDEKSQSGTRAATRIALPPSSARALEGASGDDSIKAVRSSKARRILGLETETRSIKVGRRGASSSGDMSEPSSDGVVFEENKLFVSTPRRNLKSYSVAHGAISICRVRSGRDGKMPDRSISLDARAWKRRLVAADGRAKRTSAYQERILFLRGNLLYYFRAQSKQAAGIIDLSDLHQGDPEFESSLLNAFRLRILSGVVVLKFETKSECDTWASAIRNNAKRPRGQRLPVPRPLPTPARVARIGSEDLRTTAKTLDLLLFRSTGRLAPALVRSLTASDFDHVALLIKTQSGKVCVFEAVQLGVMLTDIDGLFGEYREGDIHVTLRRIQVPGGTSDAMLENLSHFIDATCGKAYEWTLGKMMGRTSGTDFDDETRTFFCSELVAAAYKAVGLLRGDLPSTTYTPGDFADNEVTLLQGATLGRQERVVFVKSDRKKAKA